MFTSLKKHILEFQERHETSLEVLFFIGGFAFDAIMVSEIDDPFALIQQAVYLFVIAMLIHFEILYRLHKWRPPSWLNKPWHFRNLLLHFFLGTLLNIYSLFYIKSASFLNSLIFLALMACMILANELPMVKKSKVGFKVGLFSICLFSYLSILFPLALGYVGWIPFGLSLASTLALFYLQFRLLQKKLADRRLLMKATLFPEISIMVVFVFFYFMGWIPPVPLSVKQQGVYHNIEKKDGEYLLSAQPHLWWKFWQSSDQDFQAQPGDKIYYYGQIYSPARFSDQIYVQWSFQDAHGNWRLADRIPLKIVGGRKEGFRGYAVKSNYQPGSWRIQVETSLGQEISRLYFDVSAAEADPARTFEVLHR